MSTVEWRRAVAASDLSCTAKLLAVVAADSSDAEGFRFDPVAVGGVLGVGLVTVRQHWKAVRDGGWVTIVANDGGDAVYVTAVPWSGDSAAEPGALVLRSPAAVAVTSRGQVPVPAASAAQRLLDEWFAWARSINRPPTQSPLQVRQVLTTVLKNGAKRDDVARALGWITEKDETVTARTMAQALAWVRNREDQGQAAFRSSDDQDWMRRNVERAQALDAQDRSAW